MNTDTIVRILNQRLVLHLLFWTILTSFVMLPYIGFSDRNDNLEFLLQMLIYVGMIYSSLYLVYKPFFNVRYWYIFVILLICNVLGFAYLYSYFYLIIRPAKVGDVTFINFVPFYFMLSLLAILMKVSKEIYLKAYREGAEKAILIQQRLDVLKDRIQPHFLFNTLSNFYGLALDKSDKLPDLMMRLSNIMRHITYHTTDEFVPLHDEVNYIKDYIELERIRFEDTLNVHVIFDVSSDQNYKIAPLILSVLFENAFKHSKAHAGEAVNISGKIYMENSWICLDLQNSCAARTNQERNSRTESGFGLSNLSQRLDIIYGQDYFFEYHQKESYFYTMLKVKAKV